MISIMNVAKLIALLERNLMLRELKHALNHERVGQVDVEELAGDGNATHTASLLHLILGRDVDLGRRTDGNLLQNGSTFADDDADGLVGELHLKRDIVVQDLGREVNLTVIAHEHIAHRHLVIDELVAVGALVVETVLLELIHLLVTVVHLAIHLLAAVLLVPVELLLLRLNARERILRGAGAVGAVAGAVDGGLITHAHLGERTRDVHVFLQMWVILNHFADLGSSGVNGLTRTAESDNTLLDGGDFRAGGGGDTGAGT